MKCFMCLQHFAAPWVFYQERCRIGCHNARIYQRNHQCIVPFLPLFFILFLQCQLRDTGGFLSSDIKCFNHVLQHNVLPHLQFQGSNSGWGAKINRQEPLGRLQGLPGSIYFQVLPRISSAVSALVKGGISSLIQCSRYFASLHGFINLMTFRSIRFMRGLYYSFCPKDLFIKDTYMLDRHYIQLIWISYASVQ